MTESEERFARACVRALREALAEHERGREPEPLDRDTLASMTWPAVLALMVEVHLERAPSRAAAARSLGVSERTLYRWMSRGGFE